MRNAILRNHLIFYNNMSLSVFHRESRKQRMLKEGKLNPILTAVVFSSYSRADHWHQAILTSSSVCVGRRNEEHITRRSTSALPAFEKIKINLKKLTLKFVYLAIEFLSWQLFTGNQVAFHLNALAVTSFICVLWKVQVTDKLAVNVGQKMK